MEKSDKAPEVCKERGGRGASWLRGTLAAGLLLLQYALVGCPVKFVSGLSCPGCGLTRAWLAALSGQFRLALAYHPLFWLVPIVILVIVFRQRMGRRIYRTVLWASLIALLTVWAVRLALPHEANVLFSELLSEDVVAWDVPVWYQGIRSLGA